MMKVALIEKGAFERWKARLDWLPGPGMERGINFVQELAEIESERVGLAE